MYSFVKVPTYNATVTLNSGLNAFFRYIVGLLGVNEHGRTNSIFTLIQHLMRLVIRNAILIKIGAKIQNNLPCIAWLVWALSNYRCLLLAAVNLYRGKSISVVVRKVVCCRFTLMIM